MTTLSTSVAPASLARRQPYGPFALLILLVEAFAEARAAMHAAYRRYPFVD